MNNSTAWAVTSKGVPILEEYEKIKTGQSHLFTTINDLCLAYHIHWKYKLLICQFIVTIEHWNVLKRGRSITCP